MGMAEKLNICNILEGEPKERGVGSRVILIILFIFVVCPHLFVQQFLHSFDGSDHSLLLTGKDLKMSTIRF
jgi:hypothetical protein